MNCLFMLIQDTVSDCSPPDYVLGMEHFTKAWLETNNTWLRLQKKNAMKQQHAEHPILKIAQL